MSKITYGLLTLLILSLTINVLQYIKYNTDMTLNTALCNYKATSYLFSIEKHKSKTLDKMLKYDLVQLVHDYDKEIFQNSKVLSGICKDWKKLIRRPIKEYLEKNKNNTEYHEQVSNHYNLLETRCLSGSTFHVVAPPKATLR